MRLIGYVRTRFTDELAEQDLEEQERGIAEYCKVRDFELTSIVTTDGDRESAVSQILAGGADGLVVTDPLILAETLDEAYEFGSQLADTQKHLFIIYNDNHISPDSGTQEQQFIDTCAGLLSKRVG